MHNAISRTGVYAIVADAAYQGASGGTPRNVDKPANRVEDIHATGDFISQYEGIDTSRLGLLCICGGGGYSSDKRRDADGVFRKSRYTATRRSAGSS